MNNINLNNTVLLFTAPWCPSCQPMKSTFKDVSLSFGNKEFVIMNVDEVEEALLAKDLNVRSLPTLITFDADGREYGRQIGNKTYGETFTVINDSVDIINNF